MQCLNKTDKVVDFFVVNTSVLRVRLTKGKVEHFQNVEGFIAFYFLGLEVLFSLLPATTKGLTGFNEWMLSCPFL